MPCGRALAWHAPSPSCPWLPSPQLKTTPSLVTASECAPPAASSMTFSTLTLSLTLSLSLSLTLTLTVNLTLTLTCRQQHDLLARQGLDQLRRVPVAAWSAIKVGRKVRVRT